MKRKSRQKKWIKILVVIAALVAIGIIGNVVLRSVAEKKIRTTLNQFAPYVKTEFSKIHINLFTASVSLDSLVIYYQPELKQTQHEHYAYFSSVDVTGINFFKLISGKNFSASALRLNKGNIKLDRYLLSKNDTLPANAFTNVHLPFENISFGSVEIPGANVIEYDGKHEDSLFNGGLTLYNIQLNHIDSSFSKDSIHFSNIACELNDINYSLPGYHSVRIKKFSLSSRDSLLEINSLKIIPQLGKIQFGQKLGHQADRIDATVANIKVSGLDVMQLMRKKILARELSINNSHIYAFRDRRLPREMKDQPTPLGYLEKIPVEVRIAHFKLNDASVTSEEFPKEGAQTGFIKIDRINISLSPLINRRRKTDPAFITANVKGSIMNAGSIHAIIHLDLSNGAQHIKGAIEDLKLPAMNPSAENLGKFHIQSGVLDKLDFQFTATNEKASGEIIGVYHDLVIDRLKLDKDNRKKTALLPSFALHHFIIPKNKDASMPVEKRTGKIDYPRDPTRLVTFYLLKALLSGIRDSFSLGFLLPQ
jgi:hypothetical protein